MRYLRVSKVTYILVALASIFVLIACNEAEMASHNLSTAADNYEITRRIVFYNGITDTYMLTVEGRCSIIHSGQQLEVTCKKGEKQYVKHFLGLSDNVTYFAEQLETANVSVFHHRIVFRPQSILPDIDIKVSPRELNNAVPSVEIE